MYCLAIIKNVPLQWEVVDRQLYTFIHTDKENVFKRGLEHLGFDLKNSLDFIKKPSYENLFIKKIDAKNMHQSNEYIEYSLSEI
jgi:hypothetical protein